MTLGTGDSLSLSVPFYAGLGCVESGAYHVNTGARQENHPGWDKSFAGDCERIHSHLRVRQIS